VRLWSFLNFYPHENSGRLQSCETLLLPPANKEEERVSEEGVCMMGKSDVSFKVATY